MSAVLFISVLGESHIIPGFAIVIAFIVFSFIQWIKKVCRNFLVRSR